MSPENQRVAGDGGASQSTATVKPAERLGRIVVWILLLALLAEIVLEAWSRYSYDKTLQAVLETVRSSRHVGKQLEIADSAALISGWPSESKKEVNGARQLEYQWRSLIWDLRIQLRCGADDSIAQVSIGTGQIQSLDAPERPVTAQTEQPAQTIVPPAIRGQSSKGQAAVSLNQNGSCFLPNSVENGHLARELVRQALLIAARDELSLPTRDVLLGESPADDSDPVLPNLVVYLSIDAAGTVYVSIDRLYRNTTAEQIASHKIGLGAGSLIDNLAARAEELSHGPFVATLKQVGYSGAGHREALEGPVPPEIKDVLLDFDLLSQYRVVRALHGEIRNSGESLERLGALAHGYAQLGVLSRLLWGSASDVFRARALLYAERLLRKYPGHPQPLWQRSYVRALVGLHGGALDDLAAAGKISRVAAPPPWVSAIEAYCRGDLSRLSEMSQQAGLVPLPQFLRLLATADSEVTTVRLESAQAMLEVQPDCELAFDVALEDSALGTRRQMSDQALLAFALRLKKFLKELPEIPKEIRRLAPTEAGGLETMIKKEVQIISALRAAGVVGQDTGEPSFGALAQLIQETGMAQATSLLYLEKFVLAVDTAETLAAVKPIFEGHPYANIADANRSNHPQAHAALMSLFQQLRAELLPVSARSMIAFMTRFWANWPPGIAMVGPVSSKIAGRADKTFNDLTQALKLPAADSVKQKLARELCELSPGSSTGIIARIKYDWQQAEPVAADWERRYAGDVGVLSALAKKYGELKRFEDAVRCRKRQLELRPDQAVIQSLASLYKNHGDEDLWVEALKQSLEIEHHGLEHASAHRDLAEYYMRRKDWVAAKPHADLAADSYSGWGLICAADYYELTGDWNRSNRLRRMEAERYSESGSGFRWYLWCKRTGHGNTEIARPLAQAWIDRIKESRNESQLERVAVFYALDDQPAEALKFFDAAWNTEMTNPYHCLHIALLADELGNSDARDHALNLARDRGAKKNGYLLEIARSFQNALVSGVDKLDLNVLDWAIRDHVEPGSITNEQYFVGRFLVLHGRESEGRQYLRQAATSPFPSKYNSALAAHQLLTGGEQPGERRDTELGEAGNRQLKALQRANELRDSAKQEDALHTYDELIASDPDFVNAWYDRARAHRKFENYQAAIDDLTHALTLLPDAAEFLAQRGELLEYQGQYAAAITDYERAIEIDSRRALAHYNLAFLRAACPDASFRNGELARKHAQVAQQSPEIPGDLGLQLLAAAEAESGDFESAIKNQRQAALAAPSERQPAARERLRLFEQSQPYHRQPEWWKKK